MLGLAATIALSSAPASAMDSRRASGAAAMAVQEDGRIVLAGRMGNPAGGDGFAAVARYSSKGSLDRSFGRGGIVVEPRALRFGAIALQPDGKIVAAGSSALGFEVARYLPDGRPDPSFGRGGVVNSYGGAEAVYGYFANAVAILADGTIAVAGTFCQCGHDQPGNESGVVTLFDPSGMARGTHLSVPYGPSAEDVSLFHFQVNALSETSGTLTLAGSSQAQPIPYRPTFPRFALTRLDADLAPEGGFGTAGTLSTELPASPLSAPQIANAVVTVGDGVLVGGKAGGRLAFARYLGDGTLDPSFGSGGIAVTEIGAPYGGALNAMARSGDGDVFAAGVAARACKGCGQVLVTRLSASGQVDRGFGNGGAVRTRLPLKGRAGVSKADALAIAEDGKLLVAGGLVTPRGERFALLRYRANGRLDRSFGNSGVVTTLSRGLLRASNAVG